MEPIAARQDAPHDPTALPAVPSRAAGRVRALAQVLACSGLPTQLLLVQLLALAGIAPYDDAQRLNLTWVFLLSIADTVLLSGLICLLLVANGESIQDVFLGPRRALDEVPIGVLSVVPVILAAAAVLLTARAVAPWLHDVPVNPLAALMQSPSDIWLFAVVALVAGGVREELQRAFLLTRFERHLGGAGVGLAVTSVAFGLGHLIQGSDAALATGTLGLLWGALYLWRRSAVAPVVSHAGFNSLEILRFLALGP